MLNPSVCMSQFVAPYVCGKNIYIYKLNLIFTIIGKNIQYVDKWPRLGHTILSDFDDKYDIMNRRNSLSRKANNVLCFFLLG